MKKYFIFLLVGLFVISFGVALTVNTKFTQEELDEVDMKLETFDTIFNKHPNGSLVFDDCPRGSRDCYVTITQNVYREEVIIIEFQEERNGRLFTERIENHTGKISVDNITEKIKYIPDMWEGQDDPDLLIHLDNKLNKAIDREVSRGFAKQSPEARVEIKL